MCAITYRDPDLRQKIVETTRQLIIQNGVNNTSLAEIAKTVGISKGTLFYYYTSKADLIFDVTDRHFLLTTQRLKDWVQEVHGEMEAPQILYHVFQSIVEDEYRGKLHQYLIEQAVSDDGDLKERFREKYQEWINLMQSGLKQIFPNESNQHLLAFIITTLLDGLVIQTILGEKELPLETIINVLLPQSQLQNH